MLKPDFTVQFWDSELRPNWETICKSRPMTVKERAKYNAPRIDRNWSIIHHGFWLDGILYVQFCPSGSMLSIFSSYTRMIEGDY